MRIAKNFGILTNPYKDLKDPVNLQMVKYLARAAAHSHESEYGDPDAKGGTAMVNTYFIHRQGALETFQEMAVTVKLTIFEQQALIQLMNLFEKEFDQPIIIFIQDSFVNFLGEKYATDHAGSSDQ